jgi:hypothetical protein
MSDTVTTTPDGIQLPESSLAITFAYTGSLLTTATTVYNGKTYVKTFGYSGTQLISVSQWTKQ